VEAVGSSLPCRAIGGDFLEYLDLSHTQLAMAVGDVAGKGPAAALVAAMLQGMFSSIAADSVGPAETLSRLNAALCRRAIGPRFATLTYVTCRRRPDDLLNAGHNPPLLLTARGITP
jgi:serine phosphatase RsbU (regulator of sigma subunit)